MTESKPSASSTPTIQLNHIDKPTKNGGVGGGVNSASTNSIMTNNNNVASNTTTATSNTSASTSSKRIEIEHIAFDLQKRLGSSWDKYQTTISMFLMGKLSRGELIQVLNNLLTDSKMLKLHNQLLLANLANSLRDGPNQLQSKYFGSTSKKFVKKGGVKVSSQYEKLKKDIMSLPIRERHRIKLITRDSGKQKMANSSLTLTRQALLPKIPYVSDKEKALTGNTIEWTQDINHGLNVPLSVETFSLPDNDQLKNRMLGIAREHGITGGIDKDVVDVVYLGLENYLKNIVESAIDTVRYRKRKYTMADVIQPLKSDQQPINDSPNGSTKKHKPSNSKITLTNEDMLDTFNLFPFLVEPSGPIYRLNSICLNDDEFVEEETPIDSLLDFKNETHFKQQSPVINKKQSPVILKDEIKPDSPQTTQNQSSPSLQNSKDANNSFTNSATNTPETLAKIEELEKKNSGTKDELNWLIRDILMTH